MSIPMYGVCIYTFSHQLVPPPFHHYRQHTWPKITEKWVSLWWYTLLSTKSLPLTHHYVYSFTHYPSCRLWYLHAYFWVNPMLINSWSIEPASPASQNLRRFRWNAYPWLNWSYCRKMVPKMPSKTILYAGWQFLQSSCRELLLVIM